MKAEIKDLEDTAKKVGYLPTEETPNNPNVWQFGRVLIDVRKRLEAEKLQLQEDLRRLASEHAARAEAHDSERMQLHDDMHLSLLHALDGRASIGGP